MKAVTTTMKSCTMVVSCLRKYKFKIVASIIHGNQRLCSYSKDVTMDFVLTMSHELHAKLLSFMTNIEDGIRVIGVHIYRTKSLTT